MIVYYYIIGIPVFDGGALFNLLDFVVAGSLLGYRSGYNNGHTSKYPSDTLNGYIRKYPADTKARAVVRYLASEPDRKKRMSVTRRLLKRYESRSRGSEYEKH